MNRVPRIQHARQKIAERLRDFSISLDLALLALADRIAPFQDTSPSAERELWTEGMLASLCLQRDHPCGECDGKGAVLVPDGPEPCPTCKGVGVDPEYITS